MKVLKCLLVIFFLVTSGIAFAQDGDAYITDDKSLNLDSIDLEDQMSSRLPYNPIAMGTVLSTGTKYKGSSNWSVSYNDTYKWYEISITGHSYHYLSYVTLVTPVGSHFCSISSVGGKLLVKCYDHNGVKKKVTFGFVTFEL